MTQDIPEDKAQKLIDCMLTAAAGDYSAFFDFSEDSDSVDAIGIAYNSLLEEVRSSNSARETDLLLWRRALHDIRGPISSIPLLIDTLSKTQNNNALMDDATRQVFEAISSSCALMLAKIGNAMSRDYEARIRTERIQLRELVDEVLELSMLRNFSAEFDIELNIAPDFFLYADRTIVHSIFKNLMENAFKYRKPEKKGKLRIKASGEGPMVAIRFVDNGIGIPRENLRKVFQIYTRLSERADGLGYGLYSVKRDVETIGGEILISSAVGVGTIIEIRLLKFLDETAFRARHEAT